MARGEADPERHRSSLPAPPRCAPLSTPERGGGTTFPDVKLEVAAVRGNAVFFAYDRPHPMTRTLHGGAPVEDGEKWVATMWLRERIVT